MPVFSPLSGLLRQFRVLGEVTLLPLNAEKKKFIMKMSLKMHCHVHTVMYNRTLHLPFVWGFPPGKEEITKRARLNNQKQPLLITTAHHPMRLMAGSCPPADGQTH